MADQLKPAAPIVLGIDVGTAIVGWGIVTTDKLSNRLLPAGYGVITTKAGTPMPERLAIIYNELTELVKKYPITTAAVESLFFYNNQTTAMTVSQARGVILLALEQAGIPSVEYTPLQVKQGVSGYGKADKKQVQQMVKTLLGLKEIPKPDDAADALAIAITHINHL